MDENRMCARREEGVGPMAWNLRGALGAPEVGVHQAANFYRCVFMCLESF